MGTMVLVRVAVDICKENPSWCWQTEQPSGRALPHLGGEERLSGSL